MLTIKRYPNRKFYDTEEKRYITLEDITARIRQGREIQVIDNTTGEDITPVVLTQIIFEQEKKQTGFVPRAVLTGLVQAGGLTMGRMRKALASPLDLLNQIDEEIELRIDRLIRRGEIAEEEARRWRDKLLAKNISFTDNEQFSEEKFQQLLDERGVPSGKDMQALSDQLEQLVQKLDDLGSLSEEKK
jgi:polyhydroxyalkanoate synthesis repressor PhaR